MNGNNHNNDYDHDNNNKNKNNIHRHSMKCLKQFHPDMEHDHTECVSYYLSSGCLHCNYVILANFFEPQILCIFSMQIDTTIYGICKRIHLIMISCEAFFLKSKSRSQIRQTDRHTDIHTHKMITRLVLYFSYRIHWPVE